MINETDLEAWEYYNKPADDARLRCMTPTDMVQEFMHLTGQTPTAALYFKLIQEEHLEWLNEWRMGINPAAELKELADLVYVIYGYAVAKGWDLDEALFRTHKNNVGRSTQDDGTILRREDGKIVKNPNYKKVTLEDLV